MTTEAVLAVLHETDVAPDPSQRRETTALAAVRETFQRWLHLPDPGALYAALGTVAANRLDGDPCWVLLVGSPGGGKSELLGSLSGLPDVYPAATLTEASLLSGTPKRERDVDARGGLLRVIGDFGIVLAKDFGSVLNMNRDARASLLAALREVYDGAWTRHVGTDGGRTLAWSGKVGFLGGCTPTIDRHHAVMGSMGERFCLYRIPEVDPNVQAREALRHAGRERAMRRDLSMAVERLFEDELRVPPERTEEDTEALILLSTLVVRARSAVERDGYSREIELVPGAEAPARLAIVLDRLLAGLDAVGVSRVDAWAVVQKAALDSVPALRLAVLYTLADAHAQLDTNAIASAVRHPAQTTRRALEDLTAYGLVEQERQGEGKAHLWALSAFTRERLPVPEMSEGVEEGGFPEMSEGGSSPYISRSACSTTFRESPSASQLDINEQPPNRKEAA